MCGRTIHSLDYYSSYADDMTLIDTTLNIVTNRVTVISQGALEDADMFINVTKTESMHG